MTILEISLSASIIIVIATIIRTIAINKLPKKFLLLLWGVILCRLLIPFTIPSKFSIYSILRYATSSLPHKTSLITITQPYNTELGVNDAVLEISQSLLKISVPTVMWFIGISVCALYFTISYIKSLREFQQSLPIQNDYVKNWQDKLITKRLIDIRVCEFITSPLTYGIFKPVILLPKHTDWKNHKKLYYILIHEYIHIKHFDALIKLMLAIALCVHWFNPLVWIMYVLANRDIELLCDETVIRTIGNTQKSDYAMTLINMEETKFSFGSIYSSFSRYATEERINAIMKMKKMSIIGIVVTIALIIATTLVFATSAATRDNDIMKQDKINTWTVYDSDDSLVYHRTVDDNDNEVLLDYIPENPDGDIKIKRYEDIFSFYSMTMNCRNGVSGEHKRANGELAIYTNDGGSWNLTKGQSVDVTFDTKRVEGFKKGQGILFGYVKNNEYILYKHDSKLETDQRFFLLDKTTISFIAPEDGEYSFFIVNMGSDTIYINSCVVTPL